MYQSFVGLEIHIQLLTQSKVFCNCRASFGDEPNTNVCPVCMGYPGVLPSLNEEAMKMSYLVARALNCTLAEETLFDRKNYYYPDLPKNYQITQFHSPVGVNGSLEFEFRKKKKKIRIHDVHLEEDAGKMIHAGDLSLLDFNRTGTPLLEIVTEPDLETGEEAEASLQHFRRLVRYMGVCNGNMEEGSMRCDANISVNLRGKGLGRKTEIKNLNSSRFVKLALNHEIERHEDILTRGGTVKQETRLWNENRDVTESMRSKEEANDYRYFPDPDLPPFKPTPEFLQEVEDKLIELPIERQSRMKSQYSLSDFQSEYLSDERSLADYFENTVALGADPQQVFTWLSSDVKRLLNRTGMSLEHSPLSPERLAEMLSLLAEGRIHGKIAKQVLTTLFDEDKDPSQIIREKGLEQITDTDHLSAVIDEVLSESEKAVAQIKAGDSKPMGFLVGQIMKKTGGRALPQLVQKLLKDKLAVQVVPVLFMGGAISGVVEEDGTIVPGIPRTAETMFGDEPDLLDKVRFEALEVSRKLSEEVTPDDLASLISAIQTYLEGGKASGLVIAHGTDTLSYTASLLFWLFSNTGIPVVLAASASSDDAETHKTLRKAVAQALNAQPGIYVVFKDQIFSPLNLKFQSLSGNYFANWNLEKDIFKGSALLPGCLLQEKDEWKTALNKAFKSVCILKVFPGMQSDMIITLIDKGFRYFIMELYDSGTANMRESPYSLKKALQYGRDKGVSFFCTSQQKGVVDFSEYLSSHALWREGAVPMGSLTTESAYTRLLLALFLADSEEQTIKLMEDSDAYTD